MASQWRESARKPRPVVGHAAQVGVARLLVEAERVGVVLQNAPDGERTFVLVVLVQALATIQIFAIRGAPGGEQQG
jgi:hypothetical protein